MTWARIRTTIVNWPASGGPPTFEISSDENGAAAIELAYDTERLVAPAAYSDPLRYYITSRPFSATLTNANGTTRSVSIPAQTITLSGNTARWTVPAALWQAYVEEHRKAAANPSSTTFRSNIYYRVRLTAPGATAATVWPPDTIRGNEHAPHIGIVAAAPAGAPTTEPPDGEAIGAMGGTTDSPTFWADMLRYWWRVLPQTDAGRQALAEIFDHTSYRTMPVEDRARMLRLWVVSGSSSRARLPRLLSRLVPAGGGDLVPIALKRDYRDGRTLLHNLLALSNILMHPDIEAFYAASNGHTVLNFIAAQEQLLDDVITELLDPNGQINQGAAGTCSPTSIQTLLIGVNPAEYARLMCGLLSTRGEATLANGHTASIPPRIYQIAAYPAASTTPFFVRTFSELGFQATLLRYAQAARFPTFNPASPPNSPTGINTVFQRVVQGGLLADETKRALDGLFNVNHTSNYIPNRANGQTVAAWMTSVRAAQPTLLDGLLRDLPSRQQQMLLATFWSALPPAANSGGHAMLAVRRDGGRVFFKNPQYAGSAPAGATGATATNPPRRYEDPTAALESFAEGDLRTWIKGYWLPERSLF